jgi:UDP-2-acetamido-3-amino-2,3-dideoxy-glucuronate N-acetyltransferase
VSAPSPTERREPEVHATAVVDAGAVIGDGTKVWHFCHVMAGARVGAGCVLGQNVFVAGRVVIGDGCRIQNNVSLYDGVELGAEVFVGPSAVFTNVVNPRAFISRRAEILPTRVGRGASIGANATIVCGNELGEYCLVGAGAVVTRDVPAHAVVVGVPARRRSWVCRCGAGLKAGLSAGSGAGAPATAWALGCAACGATFRMDRGAGGVERLVPG